MSLERPHYDRPLRKNLRIAVLVVMVMSFTAMAIIVPRALCDRAERLRLTDLAPTLVPAPVPVPVCTVTTVHEDVSPMSVTEIAPGIVDCDVGLGHCLTSEQLRECAIRGGMKEKDAVNMAYPPGNCFTHSHINVTGDGR